MNKDIQIGNTIFHYSRKHTETQTCIRCGGSGKANPFTYPDQAFCCGLCNGKGKMKVECVPTSIAKS